MFEKNEKEGEFIIFNGVSESEVPNFGTRVLTTRYSHVTTTMH
jgi:hypothetical protein